MTTSKIIGIALLVIGLIVLWFGYQSSQGLDDQLSEAVTGEYTRDTMMYWLAGGVCVILGVVLTLTGRR